MKKRILSILLSVCMLLSVVPMMTFTASAESTYPPTCMEGCGEANNSLENGYCSTCGHQICYHNDFLGYVSYSDGPVYTHTVFCASCSNSLEIAECVDEDNDDWCDFCGTQLVYPNYVCYIDKNENGTFDGSDVKYESVSDAVEAIGGTEDEIGSGVIILLENTTDNITVGFYQGITIDLSGKTLSAKDTAGTVITNNGTAIVTDTSATGNGGNITGGAKGIEHNGLSLTLQGKANVTGNTANIYLSDGSFVDVNNNDGVDKFTGTVGFTTETAPTAGSPISVSCQNTADFAGTFLADTTGLILYSCKTSRIGTPSVFGPVFYYVLNCGVPTVEGKLNSTTTKTYGSVQDAFDDDRAEEIKMIADSEENVTFNCGDTLTANPVTLDLNGHILKAADSSTSVIRTEYIDVTIKDSNPATAHTEDLPNGGLIVGGEHGIEIRSFGKAVSMYGGTITGNNCPTVDGGAGVYLYNGTFNMYGGTICNNSTSNSGGAGVRVYNDTVFNMYNGTISNNVCDKGAGTGVYNAGTFNMYGGKITDNVTVKQGFSFGLINLNGAGVYNDGEMTVGGDAVIVNNTNKSKNTTENLYLNGTTITLASGDKALKSGAIIGVTTSISPDVDSPVQFTENGENSDKYYFFSDKDDYGVKYNENGYLELVVIDYDTTPVMNYSANLTLAQNIDIGITVKKNESSAVNIDADKLKIYADGEVVTLNDDLEGTLAKVEPKDIGTLTGVTVEYDGVIVKGFGYSVAKYCAAAFKAYANDSDTYASLNTLCEAILNYGKYAEDYANNNTASTVNAGHEIDFSKVNLPTSQKVFASNTTYGATGSGAYLTLESTVKLNYYVKSSFAYNNSDTKTQNFFILNSENKQIDPKKVSISEAEGGYIISIDLYAYQLCNEYTLKVKDVDLKDFCITFGVYDYCTEVQDMSGSAFTDTLKTLCKAIYSYSEAVRSYSAE